MSASPPRSGTPVKGLCLQAPVCSRSAGYRQPFGLSQAPLVLVERKGAKKSLSYRRQSPSAAGFMNQAGRFLGAEHPGVTAIADHCRAPRPIDLRGRCGGLGHQSGHWLSATGDQDFLANANPAQQHRVAISEISNNCSPHMLLYCRTSEEREEDSSRLVFPTRRLSNQDASLSGQSAHAVDGDGARAVARGQETAGGCPGRRRRLSVRRDRVVGLDRGRPAVASASVLRGWRTGVPRAGQEGDDPAMGLARPGLWRYRPHATPCRLNA